MLKNVYPVAFAFSKEDMNTILDFAHTAKNSRFAVQRQKGRYEIQCDCLAVFSKAPSGREQRVAGFVRKYLHESKAVYDLIEKSLPPLLDAIAEAGVKDMHKKRCYVSIFLVEPGAKEQDEHVDANGCKTYYTCFVPITDHQGQGDTEFGRAEPFVIYPGAKVWGGDVYHRGGANRSRFVRIAIALVLSQKPDENRKMGRPFVWPAEPVAKRQRDMKQQGEH